MNSKDGILWSNFGPRLEATRSPMRNGDNTGPFRLLHIGDLNPEVNITWVLTRMEMMQIGIWFFRRAFFPTKYKEPNK